MPKLLLTLLLFVPALAAAHPADLLAVRLTPVAGAPGVLDAQVRLTAGTLRQLVPGLPADLSDAALSEAALAIAAGVWDDMPLRAGDRPCVHLPGGARVAPLYVELTARYTCGEGPLSQRFRLLSVLADGHHVAVALEGTPTVVEASGGQQLVKLGEVGTAPSTGQSVRSFGGWVLLGIRHILEGLDHLAFLAVLLLSGGGLRRLVALVTTFTVAHSLTLGATALGWVQVGETASVVVEVCIALSIVVLAAQNLRRGPPRHRLPLTFAFGLLHGFGFAGVLGTYGLGERPVMALGGFNLGVELGQAAVILLLAPALAFLRTRPKIGPRLVPVASVLLLALGLYWCVERVVPVVL
ncbi:MAG TPA: HupE/UreJ family protein [Myxococcaceae bacterium]|nr:HupE/UreJ family protein [Myxococcaceae bacterium]